MTKPNVRKITDTELSLLRAAAPRNTVLPIKWWADFLTLFLGRRYSQAEARRLLMNFNATVDLS